MSLPSPIQRKIKLLNISFKKRVNSLFSGRFKTRFKGQGIIFSTHREYVEGDDVRTINWMLTAKRQKTFIKTFEEERGGAFFLVVDLSASLDFGSANFKGEHCAEFATLMAYATEYYKDSLGALFFSDRVEHYIPTSTGPRHVQKVVHNLWSAKRTSLKTDMSCAFRFLEKVLKKPSYIIVLSDFMDSKDFTISLSRIARKHQVLGVIVRDPLEVSFPQAGFMDVTNPEGSGGQKLSVYSTLALFRKSYKKQMEYQHDLLKKKILKAGAKPTTLWTNKDAFSQLRECLKK